MSTSLGQRCPACGHTPVEARGADDPCPWCNRSTADAMVYAQQRREQLAQIREARAAFVDNRTRERLQQAALDKRAAARGKRDPDAGRYFYEVVEEALHAAGVVEVSAVYFQPGVVVVRAQGLFGRALREDQACEILERADAALKADRGGFRTQMDWGSDPPRLAVGRTATQRGLFD